MIAPRRSRETAGPGFNGLTAADLMEQAVQFAHRQTKADVLASLMIEGFGSVPILDEDGRLCGIATEFDLLAVLDSEQRLGDISAEEVMSNDPLSVSPHTDVRAIIHVLQANHLIRVPVVDHERKLIGMVARRDVLKGYINSKPD